MVNKRSSTNILRYPLFDMFDKPLWVVLYIRDPQTSRICPAKPWHPAALWLPGCPASESPPDWSWSGPDTGHAPGADAGLVWESTIIGKQWETGNLCIGMYIQYQPKICQPAFESTASQHSEKKNDANIACTGGAARSSKGKSVATMSFARRPADIQRVLRAVPDVFHQAFPNIPKPLKLQHLSFGVCRTVRICSWQLRWRSVSLINLCTKVQFDVWHTSTIFNSFSS